jgi:hypothetical protein
MVNCSFCEKWFRDRYALSAHLSRLKPSRQTASTHKENGVKTDPKNFKIDSSDSKIDSHDFKIDSGYLCQFCLHTFKSKFYKNNHEKNCKCKEDPIRLLELEHKVDIDIPENKLECRFCNLIFCKTSNLNRHTPNCKDREKYLKNLQEYCKPTIVQQTINNNNNITINGNVNIINSIDLDIEEYLYCMKVAAEEYNRSDIPKIAGESLCLINKELSKRNPEYQIITFPYLNSMYANEKTEAGTEMISVEKGFNRILKSTSKNILTHGKEIDNYDRENKIVGNFEGTNLRLVPQVMKEVQAIEKMGVIAPEISHSVLNSLKMNNLEK